jgi:L-ascorbate metabolism protein UlaG (beta-lactamase superfamily)
MQAIEPTDSALGDRLTFLGHSTVLIEMAGARLLTDPVLGHVMWSLRRRAARAPASRLVDVDAVFISHGHFDQPPD